ncbi:hypothetical protein [Gordonia polyisoprenivorans]|uniref:hypothetical protein n=1 Tax=Gordonia polyisoprenivorans TaxID=84595 RepID=UPI001AD63CA2|nr:hypothetical protein [Gordonia polyisoprenivorans]QTI66736.1 hypothetical protein J6U32_13655 [Gordonia polyisoprenivorans]
MLFDELSLFGGELDVAVEVFDQLFGFAFLAVMALLASTGYGFDLLQAVLHHGIGSPNGSN